MSCPSQNISPPARSPKKLGKRRRQTGEEIVLTRQGKPVARVVPDRVDGGARQLGFARGEIKLLPGWDEPVTFEEFVGAQAKMEGLAFVTRDQTIQKYDIETLW